MGIFRAADTMCRMETAKSGRRTRRRFTEEFKPGAVRLIIDQGKSVSPAVGSLIVPSYFAAVAGLIAGTPPRCLSQVCNCAI